jgi:hypothetical protein
MDGVMRVETCHTEWCARRPARELWNPARVACYERTIAGVQRDKMNRKLYESIPLANS